MNFYSYAWGMFRRSFLLLTLAILFSISGCKKFVQIGPPTTQIVTANVYDNPNAVTAALLNIYMAMVINTDSWEISQNNGLLADELTSYSTDQGQVQFYTNSMSSLTIGNEGDWYNPYNYIYQANSLISGLQNNANINSAIAQQITGEALFIRAFWHFYLANMYGDVPLVTTTDYTITQSLPRTPRAQVYSQIIKDLEQAQTLLNSNYVDATDTALSADRIRPNKSVATALLARVFLYAGQYDSAKIEATSIINNSSMYSLCTVLSGAGSVFQMNSTEAIWQWSEPNPPPLGSNTPDAQNFTLVSAPSTGTQNSCTISPQLLNAFEPGDQRRLNWIDSFVTSNPTINYYFPYKYQSYNNSNITEYTMVLRLAEQYLIRAEAEAQLGHMQDAATDLNIIRSRAGLPASTILTGSSTIQQADSAILHERQVELFTEWGHRWFDLIRTGNVTPIMSVVTPFKSGRAIAWSPNDSLYPIPHSEILYDSHLTQNPGYN